jgi:hypothetical protein
MQYHLSIEHEGTVYEFFGEDIARLRYQCRSITENLTQKKASPLRLMYNADKISYVFKSRRTIPWKGFRS